MGANNVYVDIPNRMVDMPDRRYRLESAGKRWNVHRLEDDELVGAFDVIPTRAGAWAPGSHNPEVTAVGFQWIQKHLELGLDPRPGT